MTQQESTFVRFANHFRNAHPERRFYFWADDGRHAARVALPTTGPVWTAMESQTPHLFPMVKWGVQMFSYDNKRATKVVWCVPEILRHEAGILLERMTRELFRNEA